MQKAGNLFLPGTLRRIPDHLLKRGKILEIALTAVGSDAADCLRPIAIMSFCNLNHLRILQNAQMPAQIAVCKRAQLFEVAEGQSLGIRKQ